MDEEETPKFKARSNKIQSQFQNTENQYNKANMENQHPVFEQAQITQELQEELVEQTNLTKYQRYAKFTLQNQYSHFYDPLNQKYFHVKGKKPLYQKYKIFEDSQHKLKAQPKTKNDLKPFIQIHQPRDLDIQKEYKQYHEQLRRIQLSPGPGAYNIAKKMVANKFQTIEKNQNVVLVKLNNIEGTVNFKSGQQKLTAIYSKQKMANPGPGQYQTAVDSHKNGKQSKRTSKLDQYAKSYESNYRFIFQVFNSQYQLKQSIPNYTINCNSNGSEYNGKPERIQRLNIELQKQNSQKQEKFRKKLLEKAKSPHFLSELQRKRTIKQLNTLKNIQKSQNSSIFGTGVQQDHKQHGNALKIQKQFNEKIVIPCNISSQIQAKNRIEKEMKIKIKRLKQFSYYEKPQQYRQKQQLYRNIGYFDGSQNEKLHSKYNVKFQGRNQTLKKILQPLPNSSRMFHSIDSMNVQTSRNHKYSKEKAQFRYSRNMIDLIYEKKQGKQKNSQKLQINQPDSLISFMNTQRHSQINKFQTIHYE